jgi:DNA-binding transcriptional MerR regulator
MLQLNFWISELAERTGVSTRTIRYYIEEGLLPQPEIRGKYAVFNDNYLVRLKLIKYLKDAYLPLREIKRKIDSLKLPEMQDLVGKFEQNPTLALAEIGVYPSEQKPVLTFSHEADEAESAKQYIQHALNRSPASIREAPVVFSAPMPASSALPDFNAEPWQRVELAPGVELNLRQPQSNKVRKQVKELIETARNIFSK